jgi:hypothetical protein
MTGNLHQEVKLHFFTETIFLMKIIYQVFLTTKAQKNYLKKPINHQLSLRINYFIDFNLLKKKKV